MALVTFTDVKFDANLFMEYLEELSQNPAAFIQSGILRDDPDIAALIANEGNYFTVPFFKPLTGDAQNYDGSDIVINGIGSAQASGIVIGRTNAWGAQDLSAELATKDPIRAIAMKISQYWREQRQKSLIYVLNGMFASTDFSSSHVHDVSIADGNNATEDNLIGAGCIIDAIQKAIGDNGDKIVAISMHSKVFARLQKLNLIQYVPYSDQNILIPTFLGKTVIPDDSHTVVAGGTSGYKYTSYLFARSSIATAEGKVKVPAETQRDSLKNGGIEWMVNRQRFVLHPYGSHFNKTTMAGISPTNTELATGTNWNKVYDNKNIPIIKLVTNG